MFPHAQTLHRRYAFDSYQEAVTLCSDDRWKASKPLKSLLSIGKRLFQTSPLGALPKGSRCRSSEIFSGHTGDPTAPFSRQCYDCTLTPAKSLSRTASHFYFMEGHHSKFLFELHDIGYCGEPSKPVQEPWSLGKYESRLMPCDWPFVVSAPVQGYPSLPRRLLIGREGFDRAPGSRAFPALCTLVMLPTTPYRRIL